MSKPGGVDDDLPIVSQVHFDAQGDSTRNKRSDRIHLLAMAFEAFQQQNRNTTTTQGTSDGKERPMSLAERQRQELQQLRKEIADLRVENHHLVSKMSGLKRQMSSHIIRSPSPAAPSAVAAPELRQQLEALKAENDRLAKAAGAGGNAELVKQIKELQTNETKLTAQLADVRQQLSTTQQKLKENLAHLDAQEKDLETLMVVAEKLKIELDSSQTKHKNLEEILDQATVATVIVQDFNRADKTTSEEMRQESEMLRDDVARLESELDAEKRLHNAAKEKVVGLEQNNEALLIEVQKLRKSTK